MELIKGLITLGVAMIALDAVKKGKEKLDKIEAIDKRTKDIEKEIEKIDYWNGKNWKREEWKGKEN